MISASPRPAALWNSGLTGGILGVDVRSVGEQQLDDLDLGGFDRSEQRGLARTVRSIDVAASRDQTLDLLPLLDVDGLGLRCLGLDMRHRSTDRRLRVPRDKFDKVLL